MACHRYEIMRSKEDQITSSDPVKAKLLRLYSDLLSHDGFGEMRVEIRILKRGQKEVILHCGRQYRFVVDSPSLS